MVDHATAKYLNDNIGTVLAKALAEMSVAQPNNGVDFLAQWLKTYAEQEEAKEAREKADKTLEEERAKSQQKLAEKEALAASAAAEAAKRAKLYDDLIGSFRSADTEFVDECWTVLVETAKVLTDASAVYLGFVDEEGLEGQPGPLITYDRSTAGSEWMTDRTLPQGTGVTWSAVTENPGEEVLNLWKPPAPEAPPVDPDSGEPTEEAKPGLTYFPVTVPCVTDVKEVHYFDLTRLGSYLAVPLVYSSYYTAEALAAAKTYEEEKLAEARRREEAKAAAEAAAAEAAAAGTEPPEAEAAPEPVEEKPMVLPGKTVKMVLCIDTLGTNKMIDESKIPLALELATACGKCKEATEMRQVDRQALNDINAELRSQMEEQIAEVRAKADEEFAEQQKEAEDTCASDEEAKKELVHKKFAYLKACYAVANLTAMIIELKKWVVAPPELVKVIQAIAMALKYGKESLYPKGKSEVTWPKLLTILNAQLFEAISKAEIEGPKKGLAPEHKLASIKALLPAEFDEEKAKAVSPAFELLWTLIQSLIAYRTADLNLRKEEYNKQKEEQGEAFAGPALEELDDDFVE